MPDCDDVFEGAGIPFEEEYQDRAVHYAWSVFGSDPHYSKFLIQCWFDTTYGLWSGSRFDNRNSREKMSAWLKRNNYVTFEEFIKLGPREE